MKLTPREPTPEMVEAERVKFEAWCAANGHGTLDDMMMPLDRSLKRLLWTAWQARAMHDAAPTVEAHPAIAEVTLADHHELEARIRWLLNPLPEGTLLYTHPAAPQPAGEVVVTKNESGHIVAVTLQDEEGRILSVIAESDAPQPAALPGLSDAEIAALWSWSSTSEAEKTATTQQHAFARAVIAALKGKQ